MAKHWWKIICPLCGQITVTPLPSLLPPMPCVLVIHTAAFGSIRKAEVSPAMQSNAETTARERLKAAGNMPPNGIKTGSNLHLCEMLLADLDRLKEALRKIRNRYPCATVEAMSVLARDTLGDEMPGGRARF